MIIGLGRKQIGQIQGWTETALNENRLDETRLDQNELDEKQVYLLNLRCGDDSFLLLKTEDQITQFQNNVNNKHPYIKFICERENNRNLAFLDF